MHRSLEFLLEHLPAALHLVLASRSDPPLPLARLRARGQLAELRAGELRFTRDETAELLRVDGRREPARRGRRGAGRAHRGLGRRAAAGGAVAAGAQPTSAGFVAEFSGSHRFVLDYLTEEVLERQPEELRTFLLETSILERLSGPLCDAVVGRTDSQQLLESVERASLFLIPLDEERRWWRYHHLFADLLRASLQRQHPERVPELHRAAASWYERARAARRRHPARAGGRRHDAGGPARRGAPGGADLAARRGRHPGLAGSPRCRPRRSAAGRC